VLTLLKTAAAQASETATEDQASDHSHQNKMQRSDFQLEVTEEPPTSDQFRTILEYLGGGKRAGELVEGAKDEADAMRRLKENANAFRRPLVSDSTLWVDGAGE
jgi:hypothetical protein